MSRRGRAVLFGAVGAGIAAAVLLAIFQPWLLFVDVRVADELPASTPAAPSPLATDPLATDPLATDPLATDPATPQTLATGTFIGHEHATTGTATIVQNSDGSRVLAIGGLDTSNGPDLHVWLSAADVVAGTAGWYTAGSAAFIDLGPLKGNLGDQVYDIPADADLASVRSVEIWCVRFSVSFGAAQLAATGG